MPNRTQSRNAAPTGLTSRNMAARFTSMRSVLGVPEYGDILGRQGYREVTNIPSLEKARDVYRMLVDAFQCALRRGKANSWECRVRENPRRVAAQPQSEAQS